MSTTSTPQKSKPQFPTRIDNIPARERETRDNGPLILSGARLLVVEKRDGCREALSRAYTPYHGVLLSSWCCDRLSDGIWRPKVFLQIYSMQRTNLELGTRTLAAHGRKVPCRASRSPSSGNDRHNNHAPSCTTAAFASLQTTKLENSNLSVLVGPFLVSLYQSLVPLSSLLLCVCVELS